MEDPVRTMPEVTLTTTTMTRPAVRNTLLDGFLLLVIWLVPTISHALAYPVYLFEPMRVVLFGAILFSGRTNAYLMAFGLPLFSFLTSGHPVAPKFFLIQVELVANAALLHFLLGRGRSFLFAAPASIIAAKVLYYAGKFLLLEEAMLDGRLVSTPWGFQLAVIGVLTLGGWLVRAGRQNEARA